VLVPGGGWGGEARHRGCRGADQRGENTGFFTYDTLW